MGSEGERLYTYGERVRRARWDDFFVSFSTYCVHSDGQPQKNLRMGRESLH